MKQLAKLYIARIRYRHYCQKWLAVFNTAKNKPFILLTGVKNLATMPRDNHMRYLWRFNYIVSIKTIFSRMNKCKLWVKPKAPVFKTFEDLYDYVNKKINNPKVKYIDQLAIYDISLHLVWLWGNLNLLPQQYVYIHALPKRAYQRLLKQGLMTPGIVKNGKIELSYFGKYFPNLRADEIEDLLCWIGKAIRNLDKRGSKVTKTSIKNEINKIL